MSDNDFIGSIRPNEEAQKMLSKVFNKSEDSRPFITVTVEELLYEISSEERIIQMLVDSGVNIDQMRTELLKYISKLPRKKNLRNKKEEEKVKNNRNQRQEDILVTVVIENVIQNCFSSKMSTFGLEEIVLSIAILDPAEVSASAILERSGLNRERLFGRIMSQIEERQSVKALSNSISIKIPVDKGKQNQKPVAPSGLTFPEPPSIQNKSPGDNTVFLQTVEDIVKKMPSKEWADENIWSRPEVENQIFKILKCRRRSNVLIVGESGVGKTALMENIARMLNSNASGDEKLRGPVFSLDVNSLFAGTAYRGDVEKKTKMIIQYLENLPPSIICLDDFNVSSTQNQNQTSEVIGMLKDTMQKGYSKIIISVTPERLRNLKEKDLSFSQKFQEVWVEEPSVKEMKNILMSGIKNYEEFHGVSYREDALDKALIWADRYMKDRKFPEKIFQILDETGVSVSMKGKNVCDLKDIAETVSRMARVDLETLTASDLSSVRMLEKSLKETIVCQDEAIDSVVSLIKLNKAGLGRGGRDKPVGCLLFAGPTGVGKTELSKQLANYMGIPVIRFDMSEYSEPHSISKLIGAPPGYIGHQNAGQLSEKISKNPRAVIIFDEFEKAHPQIHQILLQMMDYGFFTDGKGKEMDVRQTVIILTSNVGVFESEKQSIGFTSRNNEDAKKEKRIGAIENLIAPEFRNRLDKIVLFNSLDKDNLVKIVHKQLNYLNQQAKERNVSLEFTDSLIDMLTIQGYNPKMGARPLQRLIEKEVALNVSETLLEAQENDCIVIDYSQENGVSSKIVQDSCVVQV